MVYDVSSKDGKSVALHIGSSLTLLFQFRENRVVLVWDIDKVFLNVEVGPWDTHTPVSMYQFDHI